MDRSAGGRWDMVNVAMEGEVDPEVQDGCLLVGCSCAVRALFAVMQGCGEAAPVPTWLGVSSRRLDAVASATAACPSADRRCQRGRRRRGREAARAP